jgi:hypothetical protein
MAKISSYPILSTPTVNDILIGTDVDDLNITKNFSIGSIVDIVGDEFVPYTGATGNVNLGAFNITSSSFIVAGGLSSQFLKANGTLDSTVYVPAARTLTINSVTFDLSANRSWDLNTIDTLTTTGTSGAATYIGKTLNIPQYQGQGNYITQLSGEATAVGPGNATVTLSNLAVISKILTGLNITGGTVVDTDSILIAFGKVQNQINGLMGGVTYQGTWNASTNVPFLQSSVGTKGYYYVVSVPGNTNLNGITNWQLGDWAIYNGTAWEKVDNTDAVVSVNGYTGAVVLTFSDVGAPPATRNLTINGVQFDLSADRTWTVGDVRTDQTYANPTWITSLAWSKITGTPTTLAGYGITDGALNTTELTINGVTFNLSANRTWNVGTVTSIATTGPLTGGTITGSGTIGITQSGVSSDGYLSSTDWNTFNNKQNALTNPVTGTGTINTLPMWGGATSLVNSPLSYGTDNFNFQYNSATGGTVTFTNSGLTAYAYTIQMNNFGSPRSTFHSYTDGIVVQSIAGVQVSRVFATGNLILGTGTVETGHKLTISGDLFVNTIINAIIDTDRFIVSDGGIIKYRTGAEILSDIGAQGSLTLTTTGSSGASTLIGNTLNIPTYTTDLTGYVPYTGATANVNLGIYSLTASALIKNGGTSGQFLKADGSVDSSAYIVLGSLSASAPLSYNNLTGAFSIIQSGTVTDGYLSSTDWNTFNSKQGALTLTTTGTSGASTLIGNTLNIPAYTDQFVGTVTSVGLSMPSAFTVSNSPVTNSGTLTVVGAGLASQYVRGDGSLADFPSSGGGGGSSVSYYLNGSVSQGTIGGVAYRELSKVPILGAGTDISINADGYIASFITDAGDPALLEIPAGNWNFETFFSASSGGGSPTFYVELYKYDGTTFTLIASNSATPELIAFGTNIQPYFSSLAVPQTALALTDRLAVRYYVVHSGRTITLHTENGHLCQIITTFTTGLTALNGLTSQVQYFSTGTTGTDFNISSAVATHTFNLPTASAANRGALSAADWTTFDSKQPAGNYVTLDTTQTITALKTILRGGDVLDFKIGVDTLYGLKIAYNQNELVPSGEATWSFVNTFNRNSVGFSVTPLSFFRGVLVTGERLLSASVNTNLLDYYTNNPSGRYPIYAYNTGVQQFQDSILVGFNTGVVNTVTGAIASLPAGVVANFNGRVIGSNAVNSNEFITLGQLTGGTVTSVGLTSVTSGVTIGSTPITTSGNITIAIATATASQNGLLSSTDWTTFNSKQGAITLTTTGTSGASTLVGNTLNIPNYTDSFVGTVTSVSFSLGSTGTDLSASVANSTTTPAITLNVPTASATNRGALSSANWTTFNSKQDAITLTTTGTSGAATLIGATLNIPQYQASGTYVTSVTGTSPIVSSGGTTPAISIPVATTSVNGYLSSTDWTTFNNKQNALTNPVTGTGTTNNLAKFTGASTVGNSILTDTGTRLIQSSGDGLLIATSSSDAVGAGSFLALSNLAQTRWILQQLNASFGLDWWSYNGTTWSTRMQLTAGGNLLVGTTTDAGYKLDVNGTGRFSDTVLIIANNSNAYSLNLLGRSVDNATTLNFFSNNGATRYGFIYTEPTNMQFGVNGAVRLTLASTGAATFSSSVNVGGTSANTDFRIYRTVSSGTFFSISAPGGSPSTSTLGVSGTDVMTLNASGNVGIGTASPVSSLMVSKTLASNQTYLTLDNKTNSKYNWGIDWAVLDSTNVPVAAIRAIYPADNDISLAFFTYNGSGNVTERMRITSGGNLLINKTGDSVSYKFQVSGNSYLIGANSDSSSYALVVQNSSTNNLFLVRNDGLATFSSSVTAESLRINNNSNLIGNGRRIFGNDDATNYYIGDIGGTGGLTINWYGGIIMRTLDTERMRINSSGNVLIGTTTDNGDKLQVGGSTTLAGRVGVNNISVSGIQLLVQGANNGSADYGLMIRNSSSTNLFYVRNDGLVGFPKINDFTTGNSPNTWINPASSYGIYINTSSIRYKKDIVNYDKGLNIISQLRPVYYKSKSKVDGDKQFAGFIAEEIDELGLTEFVNYLEDGRPNSLSYPNMVVLLTKAIQEQQAQIQELKNKLS